MLGGLRRRWRSRPALVEATLARLPLDLPAPAEGSGLAVAAVQMAFRCHAHPEDFVEQCHALATAAARANCRLVVFPDGAAVALLAALGEAAADDLPALDGPAAAAWRRAFPAAYRLYRATFARLARRCGLAIAAGAIPLPAGGGLRPTAHLFAADGRLVLRQAIGAGHPAARPGAAGEDLPTTVVQGCRVTILPGGGRALDAAGRAAAGQGAALLLAPTAWPAAEGAEAELPVRRLAEAANAYVLRAGMAGLPGSRATASCGIWAPAALSADGSGVLAEADAADGEAVLVAALDLAALRLGRRADPVPVAGGDRAG